jgi:hypothetical protein
VSQAAGAIRPTTEKRRGTGQIREEKKRERRRDLNGASRAKAPEFEGQAKVLIALRYLTCPYFSDVNQLYHEASPLCDVPDRGMMLAPRWETEEPITVWNVCGRKLHGLPASFTI